MSSPIKIVCFGDSFTWGHFHGGIRFLLEDRWTYKLQKLLGEDFEVIEEGMRSRTTNIDDPELPDRNGFTSFRNFFDLHGPVDILVYMLGTNDTKVKFHRSPESTVTAIAETLDWLKEFNQEKKVSTQVILVAPPKINVSYLPPSASFDKTSAEKVIVLGEKLYELATQKGAVFLDLGKILMGRENDGLHLNKEDNDEISKQLASIIFSLKAL